jgi:hypothetical protein
MKKTSKENGRQTIKKMEDDPKNEKMEDDLKKEEEKNGRQPQSQLKINLHWL